MTFLKLQTDQHIKNDLKKNQLIIQLILDKVH